MSGNKSNNKDDTIKKQGSFRRIFSSNSREDSQIHAAVKVIDRPIAQNNKEYAIFLQEYNILSEYNMLCNQDLKGIYVIPSAQNSHIWFGVQFVRQGLYQGGVFRFTISLTPNFPEGGCPKIVFQSNVFHPLIDSESGELCTSWGFPDWKKTNRIWQLIQYITKILTKVDTKMTPVNQEALNLLGNNPESFRERAKSSVRESLNQIYNSPSTDDLHFITFTQYNNKLHDPVKQEIYEQRGLEHSKPLGFSWVQPGSLQPFSKLDSR